MNKKVYTVDTQSNFLSTSRSCIDVFHLRRTTNNDFDSESETKKTSDSVVTHNVVITSIFNIGTTLTGLNGI
jgi:hypothetical protein